MAKFCQNRPFIVVEGVQRFGFKPGLPVQLITGEMPWGRLTAYGLPGGMPETGRHRRIGAGKGFPFNNRRPLSKRLWKLTKAISWAR